MNNPSNWNNDIEMYGPGDLKASVELLTQVFQNILSSLTMQVSFFLVEISIVDE